MPKGDKLKVCGVCQFWQHHDGHGEAVCIHKTIMKFPGLPAKVTPVYTRDNDTCEHFKEVKNA